MPVCPICHDAWLEQTENSYVFKCRGCEAEFHLVNKKKVADLTHEINEALEKIKDVSNAEIILALAGVPASRFQAYVDNAGT